MENVLAVSDTIIAKETMTSLEIAEVTGRQHSNVLRDIRNMAEKLNQSTNSDVNALNFKDDYHRGDRTQYKFLSEKTQNYILDFAFGGKEESPYQIEESTYKDEKGECRTLYKLNKKACFLLASGYDTLLRAKIINRWEQLEIEKRNGGFEIPKTLSSALMLAAKQAEQIEQQKEQLQLQAPKVLFAEAVKTSDKSILIGELAKILRQNGYETGERRLFDYFRRNGYLCNRGEKYNQPTQSSMEREFFEITKTTITRPNGIVLTKTTTKVTVKGQIYFINKFLGKIA